MLQGIQNCTHSLLRNPFNSSFKASEVFIFGWFMSRLNFLSLWLFFCCFFSFQRLHNFITVKQTWMRRHSSDVISAEIVLWTELMCSAGNVNTVKHVRKWSSAGLKVIPLVGVLSSTSRTDSCRVLLRKGSCIVVDIVYLQKFVLHWNLALLNVQEFYYCTYCTYKIKVSSLPQQTKACHVMSPFIVV